MKLGPLGSGRLALAAIFIFLGLAPVALSAQSEDRRRAVSDWLVEDVADEDGRTIRIGREVGDYSLDFHMRLRQGAHDVYAEGYLVGRLSCSRGEEESIAARAATYAQQVRAHLVESLARCEAPPHEVEALLQGFDRAFRLANAWADERVAELASATASRAADKDNANAEMNMSDMNMGAMDMNSNADAEAALNAAGNAIEAAANAVDAAGDASDPK